MWDFLVVLDVGEMAIALLYFGLTIWNFWLAEKIYDFLISEGFGMCNKQLHELFKMCRQVFENTIYHGLTSVRDLVFSILAGIIPKLPNAIQVPLDFIGVTKYLESSLDKYKNFEEEKKKKEREYLQYAKEIEKNRPKKGEENVVIDNVKVGDGPRTF